MHGPASFAAIASSAPVRPGGAMPPRPGGMRAPVGVARGRRAPWRPRVSSPTSGSTSSRARCSAACHVGRERFELLVGGLTRTAPPSKRAPAVGAVAAAPDASFRGTLPAHVSSWLLCRAPRALRRCALIPSEVLRLAVFHEVFAIDVCRVASAGYCSAQGSEVCGEARVIARLCTA